MAAENSTDRPDPEQVVVEVQDSRELGPVEAEELLRECLSLTHKRLDAAILRIFERLQGEAPEDQEPHPQTAGATPAPDNLDATIASALHGKRSLFTAQFRKTFDASLQRRREGKSRPRTQRTGSEALAIVEYEAHSAQVTLKSAVQAMREATLEEAFALDFRVRMLLREPPPPAGTFDNPWSYNYLCDALGIVCRELWPNDGLWRTIMQRVVVGITPHVVALHRELNVLLQDRDVLPALRVRTHARKGPEALPHPGSRALFDELVKLMGGTPPPPQRRMAAEGMTHTSGPMPSVQATVGGSPNSLWPRSGMTRPTQGEATATADWMAHQNALLWSALVGSLGNLQHGAPVASGLPELAGIDREVLRTGTASQLRALQLAFEGKGGTAVDRASIDVIAGVLEYVFDDPYLPDSIKAVFGRLQVPLLRAALADPAVASDRQHPARRFFDTLALAAVDLDPGTERGRALIELTNRLAQTIGDDFGDDVRIFEAATRELDAFLDAERAQFNAHLAEALPPLIAEDERADARAEAEAALEARLAGRVVAPEIRAFLDHECVARLAAICLRDGPEGPAWDGELEMVEELLWSIKPKTTTAARKKLATSLPALLRRIDHDWPAEDDAQVRRQALMGCLLDLHLRSLRAAAEPPSAQSQPAPAIVHAPAPALREPDQYDEQVLALARGDWIEFRGEGETVLARLAWRAPQRRRLLFTHRDGRTAFVHTPESLAAAFRNGRAVLAIEAVPLFDRAMARMVGERSRQRESAAAAA
jgi:Protein of unknown function (DUF1631)